MTQCIITGRMCFMDRPCETCPTFVQDLQAQLAQAQAQVDTRIKHGCLCPTCMNHYRRASLAEIPRAEFHCDGDCGNGDRKCQEACNGPVQECDDYQEAE